MNIFKMKNKAMYLNFYEYMNNTEKDNETDNEIYNKELPFSFSPPAF